jgi:hypothetical protein
VRTLTTFIDVAVFLWRRYGSPAEGPAAVAEAPRAVPLERKREVAVSHDIREETDPAEPRQTVRFGLDGQEYEVDLSEESAAELRETVRRYIAAGRRAGRPAGAPRTARTPARTARTARGTTADDADPAAVRAWARAHGHRISDRGPIPARVRQAYDARGRSRGR